MATFADNRKAWHDYEILETFQGGLSLNGQEVKSIRGGRINLAGSYVDLKDQELFLVGANIPPYQPANAPANYNPERARKLLLTAKEIRYLIGKVKERGLTLVPLKVYSMKSKIKLEFGLVKSKKKQDKRNILKKRDAEREMRKAILRG
ncbi:MAG: SsrA-binding protein SmpB [Patescibacteria group bacterium]|nr:SsrA-binding protein SmpB [Patescibacteria group bacterium]